MPTAHYWMHVTTAMTGVNCQLEMGANSTLEQFTLSMLTSCVSYASESQSKEYIGKPAACVR